LIDLIPTPQIFSIWAIDIPVPVFIENTGDINMILWGQARINIIFTVQVFENYILNCLVPG
jgi:hypothetical protein